MPNSYKDLLEGNMKWVGNTHKFNPDFFKNLATGQSPKFLSSLKGKTDKTENVILHP